MENLRPSNDPPDQRVIRISTKLAERLERLHQHPICRGLPDIERIAEMVMVLGTMELERSISAPIPSFHVIHQTWLVSVSMPEKDATGQARALRELMRQLLDTGIVTNHRVWTHCDDFKTALALVAGEPE